jgi:hypothetical protein
MPARNPVRRTQLISPFGVGAMVDFPGDESWMTAGLDAWPDAHEECSPDWRVTEERLQQLLGVTHFRLPPEYRDHGSGLDHTGLRVPFVRFPRWHYCMRCGEMQYMSLFSSRRRCSGTKYPSTSCHEIALRRRPYLAPVRIVAACEDGHIQDFPFLRWAHGTASWDSDCRLRWRGGRASASLSGVRIECSCGQSRSLGGVFGLGRSEHGSLAGIGCFCRGDKPWLGQSETRPSQCGNNLRVLQRGASNAYFARVVSSIYIPGWERQASKSISRVLDQPDVWEELRENPESAPLVARLYRVDPDDLGRAVRGRLEWGSRTTTLTETEYRRQEYGALLQASGDRHTDLFVEKRDTHDYRGGLSEAFSGVYAVRKLRETRVLTGFTRILPPDAGVEGRLCELSADPRVRWLPAAVVRGEGIFLELDQDRVREWEAASGAKDRVADLSRAYNAARAQRNQRPREVGAGFMMIHTLAHMLINQLSYECGYGGASLRERLYWDPRDDGMCGILIYTASGDAEGTLGGLVRQSEPDRLPGIMNRLIRAGSWCSSDPVCIESQGQGQDSANLAACHCCCLVSETSCEEGNRLLDRGLLLGTPSDREIGFLSPLLRG